MALSEYIIPFSSLKPGKNCFSYTIEDGFFKEFEHSDIQKAKIKVEIIADKHSAMLVFDFVIDGKIMAECDRCAEDLMVDISNKERLIVKFGEESFEGETDEIVVLPHATQEINLAPYLYEFIHLGMPQRKIHSNEADCNQLVIKKLNELKQKNNVNNNNDIDPRWSVLKNLNF